MSKSPEYKRGPADGNQLPKGAAKSLNERATPSASGGNRFPGRFVQPAPRPVPSPVGNEPPAISGNITGMDEWLFRPTDRPDEPVTAGSPVGAGPNFSRMPLESDVDFRRRVAHTLLNDPATSSDTKAMAYRMLEE